MVQAGLLILLVVIYTCSDWLMDLRHRRKAYARDVAARQVLEHISKYKLFKVTAKRQATKLTRKLTRTISRDQRDLSIKEELQVNNSSSMPIDRNQGHRFLNTFCEFPQLKTYVINEVCSKISC